MKKRVKTVKEYDEICSEKAEGYVFLPEKDMDCLVEDSGKNSEKR